MAQNESANVNAGNFVNPASSYQTATPQQLQAAGIQPIIVPNISAKSQQRYQTQGQGATRSANQVPFFLTLQFTL
jgi:hypothetical protein